MTKYYPTNPTLNKPGTFVVGIRYGNKENFMFGTIVNAYFTFNKGYRNYAYNISCEEDKKVRSFQFVKRITSPKLKAIYLKKRQAWIKIYPTLKRTKKDQKRRSSK